MTKSNNINKPLKWTKQRINLGTPVTASNHSTKPAYRVYKRTPPTTRTATVSADAIAAMTAGSETLSSNQQIECLERELAFTYDTFATITVHFESLYHTYASCKPELDKSKSATRLGEMEKELLIAYDDLGLQVTHLERKIVKLEKCLKELRRSVPPQPLQDSPLEIASPCSSVDTFSSDPIEDTIYQFADPLYIPTTHCQPYSYPTLDFYPHYTDMNMNHYYPQPTFMM